jgi:hypothetical protein
MLSSVTARTALRAFASSAFFLTLSGGSVPAQSARAPETGGKEGRVVVMIAPAAKVLSTVHYQADLTLDCANSYSCGGRFPAPGAHRRLNVTRMSCALTGPVDSKFYFAQLVLRSPSGDKLLVQQLPGDQSSFDFHSLNSAIDVQVINAQYLEVNVALVSGPLTFASCNATGTLDTLQ